MAVIPQMEKEELSYLDLISMLYEDIMSDECMGEYDKKQALDVLAALEYIIGRYSA